MSSIAKRRIESIDLLRGLVMIIMALDHTRDLFHLTANVDDPLNLATTTPLLYFTRWITHFCAPVFVLLSGTSIYLQSLRKTKAELSGFLIKRGLWLIVVEIVIITFGITFNPFFNLIILQVIWAIGISMVIIGLLIYLPFRVILGLGLAIVFGHNLLDTTEAAPGFEAGFVWDLLHHGHFAVYPWAPNRFLLIVYPFVPWTGLMMLGYCLGVFYNKNYDANLRKKRLLQLGSGLILLFIGLRFTNLYGDPHAWESQGNFLHTFFSFMKVEKYPPSLLFLCITVGPSLLLLAWVEQTRNKLTGILAMYGRTALFYYIVHWYVLHLLIMFAFFAKGHHFQKAMDSLQQVPFLFALPGEGYGLGVVYLIWALVVVGLYPLCKRYDAHKSNHPEKWWLSYL